MSSLEPSSLLEVSKLEKTIEILTRIADRNVRGTTSLIITTGSADRDQLALRANARQARQSTLECWLVCPGW